MKKEFEMPKSYFKDERAIFRGYVELIKPFLKGLRPREMDVFAEILYQYYLRLDTKSKKDRFKLALSSDSRAEMAKTLGMSQAILRNAISSLRKKGILKKDNTIHDVYLLDLSDKNLNLSFIFVLD
jgi:DNA-binding MarR family transcriptional regulator